MRSDLGIGVAVAALLLNTPGMTGPGTAATVKDGFAEFDTGDADELARSCSPMPGELATGKAALAP